MSRVRSSCAAVAAGAFSLVEVLVVVSLLSLIVLVLMTVFNSTQRAFRAAVTQTDVLEGSRAAMDLLTADLRLMAPANVPTNGYPGAGPSIYYSHNFFGINFVAAVAPPGPDTPLFQPLPGSGQLRTNVLENVFWLSRQNVGGHDSWVGAGYAVVATNLAPLFPLYRFVTNAPALTDPTALLNQFNLDLAANAFTNTGWSHLLDGVVDFRMRPYDLKGYAMLNQTQYNSGVYTVYTNVAFFYSATTLGIAPVFFFSNAIPASVEVELGTLEDAVLRHAEAFGLPSPAQSNYLAQQAGRTQVFRQRVLLPNVDPAAYP